MNTKQIIQPADVFDPDVAFGPGSYRQAVRIGDTVYIAGQAAIDLEGDVIGRGDIAAQAEAVMQNLMACLRDAGATVDDVVKVTTLLHGPRASRGHRGSQTQVPWARGVRAYRPDY